MSIDERITSVIADTLIVPAIEISETFSVESTDKWTSLAHLNLILGLEEEFGVSFSDDEAVELLSVPQIKATLHSKGCA